jgi:tetratricopeptide (TPR) repeat protein
MSQLLLFLCFFYSINSFAQNTLPWKKRVKLAQNFEKTGDFYQAAIYYEGVYSEKPDKEEFAYKAGDCFFKRRDYINTIKLLKNIKDKNDTYDKPGFKYAQALKQNGQSNEAKAAFESFLKSYPPNKKDFESLKRICENEIKGCDFALKIAESGNPAVAIELLDAKINTNKTEFAPFMWEGTDLYFSSTIMGNSRVFSAKRTGDNWNRPQIPPFLEGVAEMPHMGNLTICEGGMRLYFTQCVLEDGEPFCSIYSMTKDEENGWSDPVKLPDYINQEGSNTTHPHVLNVADKEILYFVSNRAGGKGGLDIWYTTRSLMSQSNNYTLPKNVGRNINTSGDEVTPYFHKDENVLYFSSNGWVSAGGFDVFKTAGQKLDWEVAQNLGFPINSYADDLYYSKNKQGLSGYFVSNRLLAPKRDATTDDDIFAFSSNNTVITVSGLVTDANNSDAGALSDVDVKLYAAGELIEERMLSSADYRFKLLEPKVYSIEISKEGFFNRKF